MRLTPVLANKIIDEARAVIHEHLIVVDPSSTIIASSEKERVGAFHEGAKMAMMTKQTIHINKARLKEFKGAKAGINMPIFDHEEVIGVLGITGDPREVQPFADLLRRMTELLIQEAYQNEQLEWKTRGLEAYVYEWANRTEVDEHFLQRGEILGLSNDAPYLVILFQINQEKSEDNYRRVYQKVTEWPHYFNYKNKYDFLIRWGQDRFALLKCCQESFNRPHFEYELNNWLKRIEQSTDTKLAVGVGYSTKVNVIYHSYKEADKALQVSKQRGDVVFYEDLTLDIILQEIPKQTKQEYIRNVLYHVEDNQELLSTIKAYLACNQSIKETAATLHIHANTLHYRLAQIKDLTGIDVKTSEGVVLFYLALMLDSGQS